MLDGMGVKVRAVVVTEAGVVDGLHLAAKEQLVALLGHNTGNVAFQQVLPRHIQGHLEYRAWSDAPDPIREQFDLLVVPEASVMADGKDFGWKADFVEHVDLPVVVIGVGFQDGMGGRDPNPPIGTMRYLRALAARTTLLGARGERSAAILQRLGIRNTLVTGCPSLFWNEDPFLGQVIEKRLAETPSGMKPLVVEGPRKRALAGVHGRLRNWVLRRSGSWVVQSGEGLRRAIDGEPLYVPWHSLVGRALIARQRSMITATYFVRAVDWIAQAARYDVCVAPRIHGSLLATQAGTPAICIAHDGRTLELATTCALSIAKPGDVMRSRSLERLVRNLGFDGRAFDSRRHELAEAYGRVLREAGLQPADFLTSIASR
jgi:hypothetical protein